MSTSVPNTTTSSTAPNAAAGSPESGERSSPTLTPEGVESRQSLKARAEEPSRQLREAIDCDYSKASDVYAAGIGAALNDLRLLFIATDEEATIPFSSAEVNLAIRGIMRRLAAAQELAGEALAAETATSDPTHEDADDEAEDEDEDSETMLRELLCIGPNPRTAAGILEAAAWSTAAVLEAIDVGGETMSDFAITDLAHRAHVQLVAALGLADRVSMRAASKGEARS